MKLVLISDTHGRHEDLVLPDADCVVHAGDISKMGKLAQVGSFMTWFGALPHRHKVMIVGNHDFLAEDDPEIFRSMVPDNVHYLQDSGVTIEGVHFWGSPYTPWFHDWAFNVARSDLFERHWSNIPQNVDVLITHGPPDGYGDTVYSLEFSSAINVGDIQLLQAYDHCAPQVHVFGHIHEGYGEYQHKSTRLFNASVLDKQYQVSNKPWVVEVNARVAE